MSKLFITGDTHGQIDISKLNTAHFPLQKELTKEDVMVVLGDWGGIWDGGKTDKWVQAWWNEKPWTTFVVLGNHCNYDAIEQLPIDTAFGAPVRRVSDSIVIAETGNIYTICDKKCLVLNGANSHDMWCRKAGVNWWAQEAITQDDANKALVSLAAVNDEIDYFFTHAPGSVASVMCGYEPEESDKWVDFVMNHLPADSEWKHFCGHMHRDMCATERTKIVYQDVILLHDTVCDIDDGACANLHSGFRINGETIETNSDLVGGTF